MRATATAEREVSTRPQLCKQYEAAIAVEDKDEDLARMVAEQAQLVEQQAPYLRKNRIVPPELAGALADLDVKIAARRRRYRDESANLKRALYETSSPQFAGFAQRREDIRKQITAVPRRIERPSAQGVSEFDLMDQWRSECLEIVRRAMSEASDLMLRDLNEAQVEKAIEAIENSMRSGLLAAKAERYRQGFDAVDQSVTKFVGTVRVKVL